MFKSSRLYLSLLILFFITPIYANVLNQSARIYSLLAIWNSNSININNRLSALDDVLSNREWVFDNSIFAKKLAVDLYDTALKINISESTYNLIRESFNCIYRGEIEAKNKGKLKMYYIEI